MILLRLTILLLIFSPVLSFAQDFNWDLHIHGMHQAQLQLQKNGTWTSGYLYTSSDTFEVEGSWNEDKIELLEFHNGLWTAKMNLQIQGENVFGIWSSRFNKEDAYYISSDYSIDENVSYYKWLNKSSPLQSIYLSPTSGLDWFGHAFAPKMDSLHIFYVNTHRTEDNILGLDNTELENEILDLIKREKGIPGNQHIRLWPSKTYAKEYYQALVEVIIPFVPSDHVSNYLNNWKEQFIQKVGSQLIDLELEYNKQELEKKRWNWQAHAYVELYARTDRCWSFALHTNDLMDNTDVEVLHYDPEKNQEILLESEIRNWKKLQRVIGKEGKDWDELIFHKEGLITIKAFDKEQGIQRKFYPDKRVRKYYRLFSPLKWIK